MIEIKYVKRCMIHPAYGYASPKKGVILIDKTLPKPIKKFVLQHEMYHILYGKSEVLANFYGIIRYPFGYILSNIYSLYEPKRLLFKLKRGLGFRVKNELEKLC